MIGYYVYFQIYVHCWKSVDIKASSSKLEKFQHNLTLLNTDYNCAVLFLSQLYRLFIYASKYIFSWTTIVKPNQNFLISSKKTEFSELPSGC